MRSDPLLKFFSLSTFLCGVMIFTFISPSIAQITPPGYERALEIEKERRNIPRLDRDSITIIDTVVIFDPETYESTVQIISSTYSLRDYCQTTLAMNNPDILLDEQSHTIIDPRTYDEITVRLTAGGKLEIKKKE